MASKKYKITQKQANGDLLELRPETDADIVNVETGTGKYTGTATTVQGALQELKTAVDGKQAAFTDGSATIASKNTTTNIITLKAGVAQSGGAISNSSATDITLAKVAATGAYSDLSGTPIIPTVNNGTLTLKAGSNTETFTANQADGTTFEVTKSDLGLSNVTNDKQVKGLASGTTSGDIVTFGADGYTVTDSGKSFTTTAPGSSSTDNTIPTSKAVNTAITSAISGLPTPMQFKGSVGTDGTITWANLPSASTSTGYTYKVITDHSTTPICKVGDTIVSNGTDWVVIPSGDEPSGTVTSVGMTVPTGLSVSGSPITGSGTFNVTYASGYSIPTTTNQTTWTNKVTSVLVGSTEYTPDASTHKVSLPAYPTQLKNPYAITINAAGAKVTDYDGSAAKTISIAASTTAGAFTVSDGTTTKTVTLAGSFTDNNQTVKSGTSTFGANAAVDIVGATGGNVSVTADTTNNKLTLDITGTIADSHIASASTWNGKYTKPSGGIPSSDLATSGVTAGTYSAVTVNNKGIVTAGLQVVEVGTTGQTTPSANLVAGGLFFKEI